MLDSQRKSEGVLLLVGKALVQAEGIPLVDSAVGHRRRSAWIEKKKRSTPSSSSLDVSYLFGNAWACKQDAQIGLSYKQYECGKPREPEQKQADPDDHEEKENEEDQETYASCAAAASVGIEPDHRHTDPSNESNRAIGDQDGLPTTSSA